MQKIKFTEAEGKIAFIQGQESALDYFFNLYYYPLSHFAFKLVEDQFTAEDIVAETFVKFWNNRTLLSVESSFKSWLYRTVRNASIDNLRKVKSMRVNQKGLSYYLPISDTNILNRMIESETLDQILQSVQTLPPKCRQVFKLSYLLGKTNDEIALELQISPHTVRKHKAKAIQLLKAKIPPVLLIFSLSASFLYAR